MLLLQTYFVVWSTFDCSFFKYINIYFYKQQLLRGNRNVMPEKLVIDEFLFFSCLRLNDCKLLAASHRELANDKLFQHLTKAVVM